VLVKYAVETKRLFGGWSRGAVWSVPEGRFREFLEYINTHRTKTSGPTSRVRHIHGDPPAKFNYPEDKVD
jgi:hypothetical protein